MQLGLKYGSHPRWFYTLSREEQVDVIAAAAAAETPRRAERAALPPQVKVAPAARDWWGV